MQIKYWYNLKNENDYRHYIKTLSHTHTQHDADDAVLDVVVIVATVKIQSIGNFFALLFLQQSHADENKNFLIKIIEYDTKLIELIYLNKKNPLNWWKSFYFTFIHFQALPSDSTCMHEKFRKKSCCCCV